MIHRFKANLRLDHDVRHQHVLVGHEQQVGGQYAEQFVLTIHHEHLIGIGRQFVKTAQVTQHHFERNIRAHLDHFEVHQRADHILFIRHGLPQLLAFFGI